jgi:adenylate cyclase
MSFFDELKRRNVIKVAAAYTIVGWLIMQAGDTLAPALHLPEWINSALAFFLILGFPLAVFFAWAFEMTPDGIKKEKDIDRGQSITQTTGQKLNHTIAVLLAVAVVYIGWDKLTDSAEQRAKLAEAAQIEQATTKTSSADLTLPPSIAVLPFVNMSDDGANEYFSDGLSEELLNLLSKIPELKVAARTSSFQFKGHTGDIDAVASQLKVAHILEGSVRKSGNQVRITAQLVKADDGYHLWSETYDRELNNIFQIQDEIATAVVDALKITLLGAAPKTTETDLEAYQLFLEAQFFQRQGSLDTIGRSIELYQQAIAFDDSYAPIWAKLASAYMRYTGWGGMPIDKGIALADEAIEMALSIDPDLAHAYAVRGQSRMYNKYRFSEGLEDALQALKLDPSNASVARLAGVGFRVLGQLNSAVEYNLLAVELDPVLPDTHMGLCRTYYYFRKFDEAETACRKVLTLSPSYTSAHYRVGRILLAKGQPNKALMEMQQEGDGIYQSTGLAMAQYALGNQEASDQNLNLVITEATDTSAYQIAQIYAFRGEVDHAFEWLDHSYDIRDSGLSHTVGDPAFESLHEDPRWEQLLEKLGLAEAWRNLPPELGGPTS